MTKQEIIIWWNDKKLLIGFILVAASGILGIYSKALFIVKFYEPFNFITGLSLYAFSWLLLLFGIFLVGWQTVKTMQAQIQNQVKRTARQTYGYTKKLPKRGYRYTKELHRKGINTIAKTSKAIAKKISMKND